MGDEQGDSAIPEPTAAMTRAELIAECRTRGIPYQGIIIPTGSIAFIATHLSLQFSSCRKPSQSRLAIAIIFVVGWNAHISSTDGQASVLSLGCIYIIYNI